MADKRYELNVLFHSGKDEDKIITDLFKVLGTSAAMTLKEIPEDDANTVGGWTDIKKQPSVR